MRKKTSSAIDPVREIIIILTVNTILEINRQIKEMSIREPWIQYENRDDPILTRKLEKLVKYTPNLDILEIAAYYLKNIILLQAFPDANHRTALTAVKIFLEMNGYDFSHTDEEALSFQDTYHGVKLVLGLFKYIMYYFILYVSSTHENHKIIN